MKKTFLITVLFLSLSLTACSSNSKSSDGGSAEYAPSSIGNRQSMNSSSTGTYDLAYSMLENEITADEYNAGNTGNLSSSAPIERKIIKNASLGIESTDVSGSYQKLLDFVKSVGGYEFTKEMNSHDNYVSITASLKVNPDSLDSVLEYSSECGEVKYTNTSGNDITAEYYDTEIRLENKRRNLQKYYEYLEKAKNVDELVRLQNEIDRLTAEIESYEGQIKFWNAQISESTINLTVYQKNDPEIIEKVEWGAMSAPTMGTFMLNGFKTVCNVIAGFFQWIIIFIFAASPFIIIGVVITALIYRARRKKISAEKKDDKSDS